MTASPIQRRSFLTLLGGAAAAWPLAARAQQGAMPVVGILGSPTAASYAFRVAAFVHALQEAGFIEAQNVTIEYRWADDDYRRLPELAGELVRAQVSLITTLGNILAAKAAKNATTTIPIVFAIGTDLVQTGLVASLNRPAANITGVTAFATELVQKRLQILHDLVPAARVFGLLVNPDNLDSLSSAGLTITDLAQGAVRVWGCTIEVAYARSVSDFDSTFASLAERRVEVLVTAADTLFLSGAERLITLAASHAVPAIFPATEIVRAGGLMSYSASVADTYRRAGFYAARILKGERPGELPVIQPTKFDFVINRKTAAALEIEIPATLLALADEVIE